MPLSNADKQAAFREKQRRVSVNRKMALYRIEIARDEISKTLQYNDAEMNVLALRSVDFLLQTAQEMFEGTHILCERD